jgi:uncharacterized lipoprotein YajG
MIHRSPYFLFFAVIALLGTGCAYTPQKIKLAPAALIAPSDRGQNVIVAVTVSDERPSKKIGQRSDAYGMGAEITSTDDIAAIVSAEIIRGLIAKGYQVAQAGDQAAARLQIEVRLLEYGTSTGFFTGGIHLRSALKAEANVADRVYEKLYRTEREERVAIVPSADTNAEWINRSLAEVIQQMFADDELLDFLSGKEAAK